MCDEPTFHPERGRKFALWFFAGSGPKKAQEKLKRVVRRRELQASLTAGLGSGLVAIADRQINPEGRIALVLPQALNSGVAWEPTSMETLAAAYDEVCNQGLRPFAEMKADRVRERFDAALALGLPDISVLRVMLAREPVVCLGRL